MTERALLFNCVGEQLVGVLSEPAASPRTAVLIVVGGPQYRVGSHRQFVLLARHLAKSGFAVLRFDCRGMGDSTGPAQRFEDGVADIGAAVDVLTAACPTVENVVLWGLCDAASVNLLYWHAREDRRVAGMVLLNPWVRTEQSLARTHVRHYYGQRLFERSFWLKLSRGEVDVRGSLRAFAGAVRAAGGAGRTAPAAAFQDRMAEAIGSFQRPILLVLCGRDLTAREFLEYARAHPRWSGVLERPFIERRDLEDADHTFSSLPARQTLEALTVDWLTRRFDVATR